MFFSCNIDEDPPAIVDNVRGWFTINENNIGVSLSWKHSNDNDFQKYIIYKSGVTEFIIEVAGDQIYEFKIDTGRSIIYADNNRIQKSISFVSLLSGVYN